MGFRFGDVMLSSYFRSFLRAFSRSRMSIFLNAAVLSVGISCSILAMIFYNYQSNFEACFTDNDRIFILQNVVKRGGSSFKSKVTPFHVSRGLRDRLHAVEEMVTLQSFGVRVKGGFPGSHEVVAGFTQGNFFKIFNLTFLEGDEERALTSPDDAILTSGEAKKIFGGDDAIGQIIEVAGRVVRVSGVVSDFPKETHLYSLNIGIFLSSESEFKVGMNVLSSDLGYGYFKLKEGFDTDVVSESAREVLNSIKISDGEMAKGGGQYQLSPIRGIHLSDSFGFGDNQFQSWAFVYSLLVLGLVTMAVSCVNYVGLANSMYALRYREISVRKILGADRKSIFIQYIFESFLVVFISFVLSAFLLLLMSPWLDVTLDFGGGVFDQLTLVVIGWFILLVFMVSFASGFYPSIILSGMSPCVVLSARGASRGDYLARRIMVWLQFVFPFYLIAVCCALGYQIHTLKTLDSGYDLDEVAEVIVNAQESGYPISTGFYKRYFENLPYVESVSNSIEGSFFSKVYSTMTRNEVRLIDLPVDRGFLEHYRIELLSGRDFNYGDSAERTQLDIPESDTGGVVILTKKGLDSLGVGTADAAIGMVLNLNVNGGGRSLTVIGVVGAFPRVVTEGKGMFDRTPDLLYYSGKPPLGPYSLRFGPGELANGVAKLKADSIAMASTILIPKDKYEVYFRSAERYLLVALVFGVASLVSAILGLYGVLVFMVRKRQREIGMRRVLGASVMQVILLLFKSFGGPMLSVLLISVSLAYITVSYAVQYLAVSIPLELLLFLIFPLLLLVLIAMVVGLMALKVVKIGPGVIFRRT